MSSKVRKWEIASLLEEFLDRYEDDLSPNVFKLLEELGDEIEEKEEELDDLIMQLNDEIDGLNGNIKELEDEIEVLEEQLEEAK